ncbi:hypothetical protein Efla_007815 [Eimeria flavescens]
MSDPAASARRAEFLLGANAGAGKEVYEYTPDPGAVFSNATSPQEGFERDAFRSSHAAKDVDESDVSPRAAYEFFRGKTYKSTVFHQGFAARRGPEGAPPCSTMEVRGQQRLIKAGGASEAAASFGELSQGAAFETPLARLHRLQGEVEEMLDFVSSFLVEERLAMPPQTEREEVVQQLQPADAETPEAVQQAKTLQVQYQTRRLSPAAQEALLFGHSPLELIEELKKLRMQLASVLSDKRTEALLSPVEPVTALRSGASLLSQHLSAAAAQLQQVLAQEQQQQQQGLAAAGAGLGASPSPSPGQPAAAAAGSSGSQGPRGSSSTTAYELYCVPSTVPMLEQSRVTSLERRLALVEGKMGLHKMSLLPHADLFEAVSEMQQRLKFLDHQKVEGLQKRVQSLLLELHALQQRRHELDMAAGGNATSAGGAAAAAGRGGGGGPLQPGGPPAAGDWQRVEQLYELCERWKAPAAMLPSLLERLKLLKGVHQEAGGMSVRLSVLEKQQEELQSWVKRADAAVSQLQKTVLDSIEWARATVEEMQQRLAAVEAPPSPPPAAAADDDDDA